MEDDSAAAAAATANTASAAEQFERTLSPIYHARAWIKEKFDS
jgi:hypothetical protein